ncbi:hypothetical protein GCM10010466_35550 [Planomonospora alba]|uniref:DUF4328 domain-containing protein n=1 Tax=Planomonospora alba TaxID=161354 RepID=A0ABP6NC02_9ACTN
MHPQTPAAPYGPPARPVRPLRAMAVAVIALLGVDALANLFALVTAVDRAFIVSALIDGSETVDAAAVEANDRLYLAGATAQTLTYVLTAVAFVIWLFRARSNAEAMMPVPHRRNAAWIVFGWGVPIVNFWYPRQIVDDIWTTSWLGSLGHTGLGGLTLRTARRSRLVSAWWLLWVIGMIIPNFVYRYAARRDDLSSYLLTAKTEIVFAVPVLACAALAATIVWRITGFQEHRRQVTAPVSR